jgi:hypothetical protein
LVNPQGIRNEWTSTSRHGSMSLMHGKVSGKDVHYISTTVMSMSSNVELDHLIEKWETLDYEHDRVAGDTDLEKEISRISYHLKLN